MNTKPTFSFIFGLLILLFLITACGAPSKPPITAQESIDLLDEWGFTPMLSTNATILSDPSGKITVEDGDMKIDFLVKNPPILSLVEKGETRYFKFDKAMPVGDSTASVIFITPEVGGAQAEIPLFVPINTDEVFPVKLKNEDLAISYLRVSGFNDYEGSYDFRFGLAGMGLGFGFSGFDTNIFYDGSEHQFYGQVELFGVKFNNDSQEPLVFKISSDKYEYISGVGTATTKDSKVISFGP